MRTKFRQRNRLSLQPDGAPTGRSLHIFLVAIRTFQTSECTRFLLLFSMRCFERTRVVQSPVPGIGYPNSQSTHRRPISYFPYRHLVVRHDWHTSFSYTTPSKFRRLGILSGNNYRLGALPGGPVPAGPSSFVLQSSFDAPRREDTYV